MNFAIAVICQPLLISNVKTVLEQSGLEKVELAFVSLEGKNEGMLLIQSP